MPTSTSLRRIKFNPPVERVRSRKRYRELFRRYGIPNSVDVGRGIFGRTGAAFVDDHDDGRIVAYAPPWIASPRRRKPIGLPPVSPGARRAVQTRIPSLNPQNERKS
jgi:hypothetical protein